MCHSFILPAYSKEGNNKKWIKFLECLHFPYITSFISFYANILIFFLATVKCLYYVIRAFGEFNWIYGIRILFSFGLLLASTFFSRRFLLTPKFFLQFFFLVFFLMMTIGDEYGMCNHILFMYCALCDDVMGTKHLIEHSNA